MQPSKARLLISVKLFWKVTLFKDVQLLKVQNSIELTSFGMVIFSKFKQFSKAPAPIEVTLSEIITSVKVLFSSYHKKFSL